MGVWEGSLGADIQAHHAEDSVSLGGFWRLGLAPWSLEDGDEDGVSP